MKRVPTILIFLCWGLLWTMLPVAAQFPLPVSPSQTIEKPPAALADYRIRNGDKISVKFLYQPELSDTAIVVRPDGKISLPMIDELMVAGLTVSIPYYDLFIVLVVFIASMRRLVNGSGK